MISIADYHSPQLKNPNPPKERDTRKTALVLLSLTVFLLMAFPLLNFRVGPVPVYAIDFPALLTWLYARQLPSTRRYPLRGIVVFILLAMVMSESVAALLLGTLLEPTYLVTRILLAMSLYFSIPKILQNESDLEAVIKAGLLGAVITAGLMIASSLPETRGMVVSYVFSNPFLTLSSSGLVARYGLADLADRAMRGQSLVGVSIVSGAFLNTLWPLLFLLRTNKALGWMWRIALTLAMILIPVAVVMSYSRGAILGLLFIAIVGLLLNSNKVRQPIVVGVGLSIMMFSWVGWDSEYFMFSWLEEKTLYQFANPYASQDTTERLFAYSQPFDHVIQHPEFLFFGQGLARDKVGGNFLTEGYDAANHAVFAEAYYAYGMLAAIAYVLLLVGGLGISWGNALRSKNEFSTVFSRAMLASLFGFASWFMLGHAAVSQPRGAMLLFFVFGLVAAQSNFVNSPEPITEKKAPSPYRGYAYDPALLWVPDDTR